MLSCSGHTYPFRTRLRNLHARKCHLLEKEPSAATVFGISVEGTQTTSEDKASVPEPSLMALSISSSEQEEPQISRNSLDLALQPFHTHTNPDGGQQAQCGHPNDHFHSTFIIFKREPYKSAPLDRLAETWDEACCSADKVAGIHGCTIRGRVRKIESIIVKKQIAVMIR